jgi:hypothetical protein
MPVMSFCTVKTLSVQFLLQSRWLLCWHIPPPQAGFQPLGSGLRNSSGDSHSVGEVYLEDNFWQLRPNFHKKRRLKSVIVFKEWRSVQARRSIFDKR